MTFEDRKDAGKRLGEALKDYRGREVLVLGLPRGGVEVAYEVAKALDADFSILVVRKLPFPGNPETGFGAIAEDGSAVMLDYARQLPAETVSWTVEEQRREVRRRIDALRGGEPLPTLKGRTVILVDDGIATGSTMMAAIKMCRKEGVKKLIVAAPIAGPDTAKEMEGLADEVVVLEKPPLFRAVAQGYRNWYDVPDKEVIEIMEKAQKRDEK